MLVIWQKKKKEERNEEDEEKERGIHRRQKQASSSDSCEYSARIGNDERLIRLSAEQRVATENF